MLNIFDSHAHYDDESFNDDRETVIKELKANGIVGVLNCGASLEGARASVKLADTYDFFYAAVGIHPEDANSFNDSVLAELREMAKNEKVRAIGEIGLDYYYKENPSKDIQKSVFRAQMQLAEELNLPVVIHDRDAHEDTLNILKEYPEVKGVLHCFGGSTEFAGDCLKLGYYLGFTGVVTFKNAKKIVEVAKEVPLERMLVETDCPYMTPVPFRGERNRSDLIKYIIEKLSEIKGISEEEIAAATINNAREMLKLN